MIVDLRALAVEHGLCPIEGVIHVGGHYGEEYAEYTSQGVLRTMWFEPLAGPCTELRRRIGRAPGVTVYQCALGAYVGRARMHVPSAWTMSASILPPLHHRAVYPEVVFDGAEDAQVEMLDRFDTRGYDMLSLDVQGYELEVLKGATDTLRRMEVVYAEVNRAELYEGCARVEDLDAYLSPRGFDRVATRWYGDRDPERQEGDAVWVRR